MKERNLVIKFNPWNFSNQNELIKDFFGSIAEGLNQIYKENIDKRTGFKNWVSKLFKRYRVTKMIGKYALKLLEHSEIGIAPTVSLVGVLNFQFKAVWNFRRGNEKPLEHQRDEIVEKFGTIGKRIIIIIDDIDRLDSDETKLIFKLVKLATNFPNTIFLLAYDRVKVGERLTERNTEKGIKGEEYLKKIIQLSFLIPKPIPEDIINILRNLMSTELNFDEKNWDGNRFDQLIDNREFRKIFPTIRDIKRYINGLHLDLKIIDKNEINLVDFVGIEAIRVFAPEVYLAMSNERILFTRTFSTDTMDDARKKYIGEIIDKAPESLVDSVMEIIRQLFPQVEAMETDEQAGNNVTYAYISALQSQETWVNAKRVCSEEMYDKYFRLTVPKSLLSVGEMEDFISKVGTEDIKPKLKEFEGQGKIRPVSRRLRGYLDDLSNQQKKALLVDIFEFAESTKDRKQGPNDVEDFATQAENTGRRVLEEIQVGRAQFLEDIINEMTGFFVMTELIKTLMDRQLENTRIRNGKEPLLTETEKEKIQKVYIAKIKSFSQEVPLESGREWWETLRLWKAWGEEKDVKIYVENMIRTDEGVLSLLREFDRISRAPLATTARKMLEEFIDLGKLDQRVDTIDESGLSEEDARIIELYKNPSKDPGDNS